MIINILNYQNGITDEEVAASMEEFISYLECNDIPCNNIQLIYNDQNVRETIDELIEKFNNGTPLLDNFDFQLDINDLFNEQEKVVLVGIDDEIKLKNPWGDAWEIIAIIKKPSKKVIWHEVAHLIGAEEHYEDNFQAKVICTSNMCIMRYGILEGILCGESLREIRKYLTFEN